MIRKLAPYTKGYRIWIILGVLCSAGEAVLELLLPKAMSQIVDVGIANGDKEYILAMGLKMILMALASLVMGVGAAALAARAAAGGAGGGAAAPPGPVWASAPTSAPRNMPRCSGSPLPTLSIFPPRP